MQLPRHSRLRRCPMQLSTRSRPGPNLRPARKRPAALRARLPPRLSRRRRAPPSQVAWLFVSSTFLLQRPTTCRACLADRRFRRPLQPRRSLDRRHKGQTSERGTELVAIEELVGDHRGCADDTCLRPENRWQDLELARRERERTPIDGLADRREEQVSGAGDAATDDDQARVEEVDDAREHPADLSPRALDELDTGEVAVRRPKRHCRGADRPFTLKRVVQPSTAPVPCRGLPVPRERRTPGESLETAEVAAPADDRFVDDLDVPDVARRAVRAAV